MPNLDPGSSLPLYRQLYDHFSDLIRSGRLAHGERLPATRELAGSLGLNRTTISAAYAMLESQGLIAGHVGRGSFVIGTQQTGRGLDWQEILGAGARGTASSPSARISFAASRPAAQLFPLDAFRAACQDVLARPDLTAILQLGSPNGYEPLRRHLLESARSQGVAGPGDDLIITSGCQQALDLVARVLVQPGDRVVVEDPVYPGLKNVFARAGAHLAGVPVGPDGMEIEALERTLRRETPEAAGAHLEFPEPHGSHAAHCGAPHNPAARPGNRGGGGGERHLRRTALCRRSAARAQATGQAVRIPCCCAAFRRSRFRGCVWDGWWRRGR